MVNLITDSSYKSISQENAGYFESVFSQAEKRAMDRLVDDLSGKYDRINGNFRDGIETFRQQPLTEQDPWTLKAMERVVQLHKPE